MDAQTAKLVVRMVEKPLRKLAQKAGMPYEQLMRLVAEMSRTTGDLGRDKASKERVKMIEALLSGNLERELLKAKISGRKGDALLRELDNTEAQVRNQLLDFSKRLHPPPGRNPNATPPSKILKIQREFKHLTEEGNKSNREAYLAIAKRFAVSVQTVRRICDPKVAAIGGCNYLGAEADKVYMAAIQTERRSRARRARPRPESR